MAGMRIGYAMGNPELIKAMNDVKFSINSYTMNRTSIAYGIEAIRDRAYFEQCVGNIVATRERAKERLSQLGFRFPDSKANFIFARHESVEGKEIFQRLKEKKIYVRYFDKPRIDQYLRITIGTDEQMERLYEALSEILK
jgi:histidinol-phosphate aminotransferase